MITKINETKALPQNAKINTASVGIDTDPLELDDNHISRERKHAVTKKEAASYIKNAVMSGEVWNGQFEWYYSVDGAAYIDIKLMEMWKQGGD